jgi:hypothetical protein
MSRLPQTVFQKPYPKTDGSTWTLLIDQYEHASVRQNGRMIDLEPQYLQQQWYHDPQGEWLVLQPDVVNFKSAVDYLATEILPWWEDAIHPNFGREVRKEWSYLGAEVHGECNRVYDLVISCALHVRCNRGLRPLHTIEAFSTEARGDVLKGIFGLAFRWDPLLGHRKQRVKNWVLAACLGVRECWNLPHLSNEWDCRVLKYWLVDLDWLDDYAMTVPLGPHEFSQYGAYIHKVRTRNVRSLILKRFIRKHDIINYVEQFLG